MAKRAQAIPRTQLNDLIARYRTIHEEITELGKHKALLGDDIEALMKRSGLEEYIAGQYVARAGHRLYRSYLVTRQLALLLERAKVAVSVGPKAIDDAIKAGFLTADDVKPYAGGKMKPFFDVRSVKEKVVIGDE